MLFIEISEEQLTNSLQEVFGEDIVTILKNKKFQYIKLDCGLWMIEIPSPL